MALDDAGGPGLDLVHDPLHRLRVQPLVHGRVTGQVGEEDGGLAAFAWLGNGCRLNFSGSYRL